MQPAPVVPPHPQSVLDRCALRTVSSEPCPLSLTDKIPGVSQLSLPCLHASRFLPPHSHFPDAINNALLVHVFLVFISSAPFLALAPYSPPSTPVPRSSLLYFQMKLGCEGAGECCPGDWLFPECCLCPAVPWPCLKRSFPPFTFLWVLQRGKTSKRMGHILLPQPGIPALACAGLHPTAGNS